jgi:hypothetical protein
LDDDVGTAIDDKIDDFGVTVGNTYATITTVSTISGDVDGLEAKYGVTIDNNGAITGYQLLSGTGGSAFNVRADQFAIFDTAGNGISPFAVYTTSRTVGGVTVPAGTYIENAYITNAEVAGLLTADKIKISNVVLEDGDNNGTLDIVDDAITKSHTVTLGSQTSVPLNGTWLNIGSVIVPIKKNSKHTWVISTSADTAGTGNVYAALQLRLERYITNNGSAGDGLNGGVRAINYGIMDNGANTSMAFSHAETFGNVTEQNMTYQLLVKVVDKTSGVTAVHVTSTGLVGLQSKR